MAEKTKVVEVDTCLQCPFLFLNSWEEYECGEWIDGEGEDDNPWGNDNHCVPETLPERCPLRAHSFLVKIKEG